MATHIAPTFLKGIAGDLHELVNGSLTSSGLSVDKGIPFIVSGDGSSIAIDFDKIILDEKKFHMVGGKRAVILYADLRKMAEQRMLFGNYERCASEVWNETWANLCVLAKESRWAPCKYAYVSPWSVDLKSRLLLPEQEAVFEDSNVYRGHALEHAFAGALTPDDGNPYMLPFRKCTIRRLEKAVRVDKTFESSLAEYPIYILDADAMLENPLKGAALDELDRFLSHIDMDHNWMNASVKSVNGNPVPRFGTEADEAVARMREAHEKAMKGSMKHARP